MLISEGISARTDRRIRRTWLLVSGSMLAMNSTAAMAQTVAAASTQSDAASTPPQSGLEDIIVTARKTEENLQNVPIAITAFSGDALKEQNATRVSDVARLTPSLNIREANSNPSAVAITLRGQVQTDVLATLDPSVGTYVDGLYWARAYGLNGNLLDVSNVQVLKGPQGTLFGRNTTGGAILIETVNPKLGSFSGQVSGTYGRFNERTLEGILNVPIGEKIAIRGAIQRTLRDGYVIDQVTGAKYADRNSWTGRGKILLQATDNLSVVLSGEYYRTDVNAPQRTMLYMIPSGLTPPAMDAATAALATAGGFPTTYPAIGASGAAFAGTNGRSYYVGLDPDRVRQTTFPAQDAAANYLLTSLNAVPRTEVKTRTFGGTVNLDTEFGAIKFIGGYRKIKSFSRIDLDGSAFAIHRTIGVQDLQQYSGELQLTGTVLDDALDFAGGLFYFNESGTDGSFSISIPTLNPVTSRFSGQIFNDSMGAYGQASWHITDKLTFTGGGRYSVDDKGLNNRNQNYNRTTGIFTCQVPTASIAADCLVRRHNGFSGWSYLASLDYKVTDDVLIYAKTSKGFRSGGQNLRATTEASSLPFQPEIAYAHEAGLKSEFFDRRLRLNVSGYYSEISNIQRTTLVGLPSGGTSTILSNAGKLRVWGIEGDALAQVMPDFQIGGTIGITRPKYLKYSEIPNRTDLTGDRRRERIENVPKLTWSVSANYDHRFDFARVSLRADYSWTGSYPLQPFYPLAGDPLGVTIDPNTGRTIAQEIIAASTAPSAGVLSARAAVTVLDDSLEIAVFGRNITDNRGLTSSLYVGGIGYVAGQYREPATYGVQATFRFGK